MFPAIEGLGDHVAARADAFGCLALRLNLISDPAAAALTIQMLERIVLSVELPKKAADLVPFDRAQS